MILQPLIRQTIITARKKKSNKMKKSLERAHCLRSRLFFWLYNQLEKIDSIWSPRLAFSHIITVDFETGIEIGQIIGEMP
ncbi:hypothetical protein BSB_17110 [Bacillus stercoris]|nr:hypothetical protein BSB_17110 [Bacillus stercoris]GFM12155.1 uncharacterized protein FW1_contig-01-149 [Bacillus sp. FW1]